MRHLMLVAIVLVAMGLGWQLHAQYIKRVRLKPGESILIKNTRVMCIKKKGGQGTMAPAPKVQRIARVDLQCISQLYTICSGKPSPKVAIQWARRCSTMKHLPPECKATSSSTYRQNACVNKIDSVMTGRYTAEQRLKATRLCQYQKVTCTGQQHVSKVRISCLQQMYNGTSGKPNVRTALRWARLCRNRTPRSPRCHRQSEAHNRACVAKLYAMISGKPTPRQAGFFATACKDRWIACR